MTVYDAAVRIISYVTLGLVTIGLKSLSKIELFRTFRWLSPDKKEKVFSLIRQFSSGYLDEYETQTKLQAFGINYSPQFMRNLFYYTHKRNIRPDNPDLSAFLSMSGPFICSNNGEVKLRKWIRTLSFVLFIISLLMMVIAASMLPGSIDSLHLYWVGKHYFLLALQAALIFACIFGLSVSLIIILTLMYRSVPAFRFARRYRAAWKNRDWSDVGEQNLYCVNKE
ncbi:hypothetical protein [Pantoea ananatis]|uniref:hypothetical protein n=1 Tax=Pantoea ananas TaxID=553 RepID=UPI000367380E|nr:hypothetical protein [Pantoea ananatis]